MVKMAELHADGVNDLHSYNTGKADEQARIIKLLERFHDELTDDNGENWESLRIAQAIDRILGKESRH